MVTSKFYRLFRGFAARVFAIICLLYVLWIAYDQREPALLFTWPILWSYLYGILLREQWTRLADEAASGEGRLPSLHPLREGSPPVSDLKKFGSVLLTAALLGILVFVAVEVTIGIFNQWK